MSAQSWNEMPTWRILPSFFQFKRRFIGAALLEALEFIGVLRVHQLTIKVVRAARIELMLEQRADLKKMTA